MEGKRVEETRPGPPTPADSEGRHTKNQTHEIRRAGHFDPLGFAKIEDDRGSVT